MGLYDFSAGDGVIYTRHYSTVGMHVHTWNGVIVPGANHFLKSDICDYHGNLTHCEEMVRNGVIS